MHPNIFEELLNETATQDDIFPGDKDAGKKYDEENTDNCDEHDSAAAKYDPETVCDPTEQCDNTRQRNGRRPMPDERQTKCAHNDGKDDRVAHQPGETELMFLSASRFRLFSSVAHAEVDGLTERVVVAGRHQREPCRITR